MPDSNRGRQVQRVRGYHATVDTAARSVVLTGISRGLGAALFEEFRRHGDRVLGIGRHFTSQQRRLASAEPGRIRLLVADLVDPAQVPDATVLGEFLEPAGDGVAVLVHSAAVIEPIGPVGTLKPEEITAAVAVNVTAPMLLTNAFLAARRPSAPARIVFVSSRAARVAKQAQAMYCATKSGGQMFFDTIAAEARHDPTLRVVSVSPRSMDTDMQAAIRAAEAIPDRQHYVGLHQRGQLDDPAQVARQIIRDHLD